MKITYYKKILLTFLILFQIITNIYAQNLNKEKYYVNNDRNWLAEIPLWVPGFRGQISYGEIDFSSSGSDKEKDVNRLDSDIGLEFYFVGRIAVKYKKIWIQADAFSGKVGSTFTTNSQNENDEKEITNIEIQSTIPRLVLGYSVWKKTIDNYFKIEITPYAGIRYIGFSLQSDTFDAISLIDVKPNWLEPLLGLYVPVSYRRFKLEIQADYGRSGSKNSWVISNRYRYRISKLIDVQLGWNFIRLYHKGIVGSKELESNIRLFGPTAGLGFRF